MIVTKRIFDSVQFFSNTLTVYIFKRLNSKFAHYENYGMFGMTYGNQVDLLHCSNEFV